MARSAAVWVQLVIDNEAPDRYEAFVIKITPETDTVDALVDAIMEKAKRRFDKDIHSLKVYPPPGNNASAESSSLPPYLLISDPGFPSGTISGQTPLIVTAKNRQQEQVSFLLVSRLLLLLLLAVAIIIIITIIIIIIIIIAGYIIFHF
jgi:hypothetical protein